MAIAGMTMPEMPGVAGQQISSTTERARTGHPSIGDMGPCERHSCDGGTAVLAHASHSVLSSFCFGATVAVAREVDLGPPDFHEARDGLAYDFPRSLIPFRLSLRI
jgi:hypothetical protein